MCIEFLLVNLFCSLCSGKECWGWIFVSWTSTDNSYREGCIL